MDVRRPSSAHTTPEPPGVTCESARVMIGGINVDKLASDEMAALMVDDVAARLPRPKLVFSANGHAISMAATDAAFAANLAQGDIRHADGMSIVFAARIFTPVRLPERIGTTDFFHIAARVAEVHHLKYFFLGGTEEVVSAAYCEARTKYPGIEWVGFRNGYFDDKDEPEICREIVASGADVVWVGLGRPKQEAFCVRNRKILGGVTWMKTCGGLFDFLAGKNSRAPEWMQNCGLEWAYRILQEPRRLVWRYTVTNTHSLWLFMTRSGSVIRNPEL